MKNAGESLLVYTALFGGKKSIWAMTGTATTTPQVKNLIGRAKISVLQVRHAFMNKSVPSSAKQQREITSFTVLMTT